MAHHGSDKVSDFLKNMEEVRTNFGATGRFPDGKLSPEDEGELQFGVTTDRSQIIIQFGKPIAWFALTADNAREFAAILTKRANDVTAKAAFSLPK